MWKSLSGNSKQNWVKHQACKNENHRQVVFLCFLMDMTFVMCSHDKVA